MSDSRAFVHNDKSEDIKKLPARIPCLYYTPPDNSTQDWQLTKPGLCDRGQYLLESGVWSDCQFIVGLSPNIRVFRVHRMILAMSSPVFEAMFFGVMSDKEETVTILDVQPDAFYVMLQYIYTDYIHLNSFDLVCDICYAAKKYMLPALVEECTKYLWRDLYPRNACKAYEFAKLFDEPRLLEKSLQIIRTQTKAVLLEATFTEVEHSTLCTILSQTLINADEVTLFEAMLRWSEKECQRRGVDATPEKRRQCLGDALFLIRYLTLSPKDFAQGPAKSGLLNQQESFTILMNIASPGSLNMPEYMSLETEVRKIPPPNIVTASMESCSRIFCTRAMIQEPHCLNTSILDCSVTFSVDQDLCIHGIEVPSQVTQNIPETESNPAALNGTNGNEYNELLYSHLLDSEGTRLTYTHFTAKVTRNSMIEILFNRSVFISANKVYRIGMVLNKVGWYPMGVCTRRVNCDGCFFTFCVGQPTDTLRDGLIRSIIFSKQTV